MKMRKTTILFRRFASGAAHLEGKVLPAQSFAEPNIIAIPALTHLYPSVQDRLRGQNRSAFHVVNLDHAKSRFRIWKDALPNVSPYYAVKCNPNSRVLSLFAELGMGFDVASVSEIDAVLDCGGDPKDIIYANPVKETSQIWKATERKVDLTTFDSHEELEKIARHHPETKLLLRLLPDDSSARCPMGKKYGAPVGAFRSLLSRAAQLNLRVEGVSFHVGSGNTNPRAWGHAMRLARHAFDIAASDPHMTNMTTLNIGGGFPSDLDLFDDVARVVRDTSKELFPHETNTRIIAEPGRYFAEGLQTLAVNVIGKRTPEDLGQETGSDMYYVNDSLYGSFNSIVYDHATLKEPLVLNGFGETITTPKRDASLWGQTCDGLDCIAKNIALPRLSVGDWVLFPSMGAYTSAAASRFNGFAPSEPLYVGC